MQGPSPFGGSRCLDCPLYRPNLTSLFFRGRGSSSGGPLFSWGATLAWPDNKVKAEILKFCVGYGADLGCGCSCIEGANGFDLPVYDVSQCDYWEDGKWDYVFSSHCLEHIADWQTALSEWMRVVNVGGYLILYLPCKGYYPPQDNAEHKWEPEPSVIIGEIEADPGWRMIECFWPDHPYGDTHSSFLVVAWHCGEDYLCPYPSTEYDGRFGV
jgi:SAM-dependent methyltransferase